ncbi:hypothetical protein Vp2S01_A1365 [Vibrio parahaemolyticus]|nr:hypothetical protein Vp2S01_A1365 [Vibrio parahaemolyticus]
MISDVFTLNKHREIFNFHFLSFSQSESEEKYNFPFLKLNDVLRVFLELLLSGSIN